MPRKTSRKSLVRKCDTLFSLYIRKRDGECVLCGAVENLQCGHLFSRVAYSTRWDPENAFCQCAGCNLKHEHDAYPFLTWHRLKFGADKQEEIHRKWHQVRKFRDSELEEIAEVFK